MNDYYIDQYNKGFQTTTMWCISVRLLKLLTAF